MKPLLAIIGAFVAGYFLLRPLAGMLSSDDEKPAPAPLVAKPAATPPPAVVARPAPGQGNPRSRNAKPVTSWEQNRAKWGWPEKGTMLDQRPRH